MPGFPGLSGVSRASVFDIKPGDISTIAGGHRVMAVPGGVFAMGSARTHADFGNAAPRMVQVRPFRLGVTPVTESEFARVMGQKGNERAGNNHPVTRVSWNRACDYLTRVNQNVDQRDRADLPTEAEWECAAVGDAINVRSFMDEMNFRSAEQLIGFLKEHDAFEKFVSALELGARIITDIDSNEFAQMINGKGNIYAWRTHATENGRSDQRYWWQKLGTTDVAEGQRRGGYGHSDMMGHVWEWCWDVYGKNAYSELPQVDPRNEPSTEDDRPRVLRGASWDDFDPRYLRGAYRCYYPPGNGYSLIGFRVAAAP